MSILRKIVTTHSAFCVSPGNYNTMQNQRKQYLTAITLILLLGTIWGTGYMIARYTITNGVPALGYSFWQSLGPALLLFIITKTKKFSIPMNKQHIVYYLVCGLIGIALPNTNMYFAAAHLPAGLLALLVNTVPIITYPLALLFGQERFYALRLLGVLSAIIGLSFIFIPQTGLPLPQQMPWAAMALLTPLLFSACAVFVAVKRPQQTHSLALATGMLITSAFYLAPAVIITNNFYALWYPFALVDWLIILEIMLSSAGYVLFFQLIKFAGPVYYSLVNSLAVIVSLIWGYYIFAEYLNYWHIFAILFILSGLFLVTMKHRFSS